MGAVVGLPRGRRAPAVILAGAARRRGPRRRALRVAGLALALVASPLAVRAQPAESAAPPAAAAAPTPGPTPAPAPRPAPRPAPAQAQAPQPAAPPAASANGDAPERTSAQFGDWTVQCVVLPQGNRRACEMAQPVQDQQRQQTVAIVALGRPGPGQPMKLAARVPVNVTVTQPARLMLDGPANAANEPLSLPFARCTVAPVGCFAELNVPDAALRRLRSRPADQAGRVVWRDAVGNEASIPVSFRGFAPAYEALLREAGS
jgi:invasion protein IalB